MGKLDPSTESSSAGGRFIGRVTYFGRPVILPVLLAIVPTLYLYGNNVAKLTLESLYRMLLLNGILAIVVYTVCLAFTRFQRIKAAIASFIFLIFFNIYGLAYRYLLNLDVIPVRHYTLLPLMVMLAVYVIWFMIRMKEPLLAGLWKGLLPVLGFLVLFNLINIIPAEFKKWKVDTAAALAPQVESSADSNSPDIYFIILDEFEGFQGMREYWHYQGVDDFANFLKEKGFFAAEDSHAGSTSTLHQMATRLNYKRYARPKMEDYDLYFNDIAHNRVMRYLKARGYTIVVFDETKLGYPAAKSIQADYLYEYGSPAIPQRQVVKYGLYFDEFGGLVADNTMLYAIPQKYRTNNASINNHTSMISFTMKNIVDQKVPSPKLVYVHLLLPHMPFIYNESGEIANTDHSTDWNYYIENYKFSINVAEKLVDKILQEADPENPPVIILQSDHGARNYASPHDENARQLKNYPEELKSLILNALYLPGYDYTSLPQDLNPDNTFPLVFNYLFNAGIPLLK